MPTRYVALNEDVVNPLLARNSKYTEATITNVQPKFPSLKFLTQKKTHLPYHKSKVPPYRLRPELRRKPFPARPLSLKIFILLRITKIRR